MVNVRTLLGIVCCLALSVPLALRAEDKFIQNSQIEDDWSSLQGRGPAGPGRTGSLKHGHDTCSMNEQGQCRVVSCSFREPFYPQKPSPIQYGFCYKNSGGECKCAPSAESSASSQTQPPSATLDF